VKLTASILVACRWSCRPVRWPSWVLATILAPLVAGIAVRRFAPANADRVARPIAVLASVILAGVCSALYFAWVNRTRAGTRVLVMSWVCNAALATSNT